MKIMTKKTKIKYNEREKSINYYSTLEHEYEHGIENIRKD